MRNPREMRIIEIEITNACVRECSNCTRFCGHHEKPFFIDFETFKRAVDSLDGYEGILGMMGGEPTLHPEFKKMAEYIKSRHPMKTNLKSDKAAVKNFPDYVALKQQAGLAINKDGGPGLLTSITKQYYDHYELIQETFSFQNLNDHSKPSYHQPILVSRKDFGISDEEWTEIRDNCWLQNYWSASVGPKGVFFCEVAASLDMLFNGPGGFPIEDGWWKRDVEEFSSQFHWCELCGVALKTFDQLKRDANEEIDDISPSMLERLKEVGSRKVEKGKFSVVTATKDDITPEKETNLYDSGRYVGDYSDRFGVSMSNLRPKTVSAVVVCPSSPDGENGLNDSIKNKFDEIAVINSNDIKTTLGNAVYNAIKGFKHKDWITVLNGNADSKTVITLNDITDLYLNPGICFFRREDTGNTAILFNINATAFKNNGYDGFYNCESIDGIKRLWGGDNISYLDEEFNDDCLTKEIERFMLMSENEIVNDCEFRNTITETLTLKGIKKGDKILMITPCTFYYARATAKLLENMSYDVSMFVYEGNAHRFNALLSDGKIHTFKGCPTYNFEKCQDEINELIKGGKYDASVMLVSMPYSELRAQDGYGEAKKIAEYTADKFAGCFNIRRKEATFKAGDN